MAQTELHKYTATEKINRMDVDLIDIEATLTTAGNEGRLMFDTKEIPFAVAGPGGASIIHSIVAVFADDPTDGDSDATNLTDGFRIVFTSDSTSIGSLDDAIASDTSTRIILDGICGFTDVATIIDHGLLAVASTTNIGIIAKAEDNSTSLYCYGITQSTNTYTGGKITLRIGVIKN